MERRRVIDLARTTRRLVQGQVVRLQLGLEPRYCTHRSMVNARIGIVNTAIARPSAFQSVLANPLDER
jgi:hypothetical protein